MPQINRVRVNNVKYNFGTQFYDDFIMRFNCRNTIYDLANGGGKSLLMLLLMQNMLPNCTLDEKQPVEKLFRKGSGNTCIHSLIEWKLDSCCIRDGYKYMTTGFCARKARSEQEDKDSIQAEGAKVSDNASIEYFNYCIFYKSFGDNDIKNLPLVVNNERVTYNGLKAYLRDIMKSDYGVEVHIFDRKGDYQSFISKYGIYESAWEIVRGINKTEGHVRTYFETNYRTSRKVVEDLLIEEIIQKSYNNRLSVDNDDAMMAKMLIDIKDKLVELSKKSSQINDYDSQMESMTHFIEYINTYNKFYEDKKKAEDELGLMHLSAIAAEEDKNRKTREYEEFLNKLSNELEEEKRKIAVAKVLSEKKSKDEIEKLVKEASIVRKQNENRIRTMRERLMLMESANDYFDYLSYKNELIKVNSSLENRLMEDEDITAELKNLAGRYRVYYKANIDKLSVQAKEAASNEKLLYDKLEAAKEKHQTAQKNSAVITGLKDNVQLQINEEEQELKNVCQQYGVLVADTANEQYEEKDKSIYNIQNAIDNIKHKIEKATKEIYAFNEKISLGNANMKMLENKLQAAHLKEKQLSEYKKNFESIVKIYGGLKDGLADRILSEYTVIEAECIDKQKQIDQLNINCKSVKAGKYYFEDANREKLKKYLLSCYSEDVLEGSEWLKYFDEQKQQNIIKKVPFIEYAFVIKNDFNRVKNNDVLKVFGNGTNIYPIVSEHIINEDCGKIDNNYMIFLLKNMAYLKDNSIREKEVASIQEEIEDVKIVLEKLNDKKSAVWEDYLFITKYELLLDNINKEETVSSIKENIEKTKDNLQKITYDVNVLKETKAEDEKHLQELLVKEEELKKEADGIKKICDMNGRLMTQYAKLKDYNQKLEESERIIIECAETLDLLREEYINADEYKNNIDRRYTELNDNWENKFAAFYETDDRDNIKVSEKYADNDKKLNKSDIIDEVQANEITAKFMGLKDILANKNTDIADKEQLKSHLESSMRKCESSIEYRKETIEHLESLYAAGQIAVSDTAKMRELSLELAKLQKDYDEADSELASKEALLNRLEGSISHAAGQIVEKYGRFEEFECDNPEEFVKSHMQKETALQEKIKKQQELGKKLSSELKDIQLCRKDIERIMSNAGIDISDKTYNQEDYDKVLDYKTVMSRYEKAAKEYLAIQKSEYKKLDEFAKYKAKLVDELKAANAEELAVQTSISVNMPSSIETTKELVKSLNETNLFIEIEKSRVHKGIEDMERIKDNFENRCIQICSNIKTELERLPKLSHINMDNEDIAIISLHIPYVSENIYKERMSAYIDETVEQAEKLSDSQERFKYIRNRLTWKRLFSVIVTDMDLVRINLYKRERIKDMSRYLRYEEAVGSTGQSQGIYIQFLIAVINYIANMNTVSDGGVVGKTIFIDNPFGAAKDIYIWEPIFKLLAVNHVQLIVPARGATPAITSRFDVNYILGQKLADNRQQTVVVDYYSSVKETELEYTRMDYEQATFDFI